MRSISVVIRTFNSAKSLAVILGKLTLDKEDELIIVDSGSSDRTLEVAHFFKSIVVVAHGAFNYSKSLNLGFAAAKNPWVLVMSSHSMPMVDDLVSLFRREMALFPENVVVGYGPSTLSGKADPQINLHETSFFAANDFAEVQQVCGNANTIYRREKWIELPFDETIRTAEDKLWIMEMIKRGYQFAYLPMAPTQNQNRASLAYMFRKGYGDARALRSASHKPMTIFQFGGALKNMAKDFIFGGIGWSNWIRYSAHIFGQFLASYQTQDNSPKS